jgi:hypothetical protein
VPVAGRAADDRVDTRDRDPPFDRAALVGPLREWI